MDIEKEFFFGERTDKKAVEEAMTFAPKFDENGLITVVTQDADTNEVLMVAYMNAESLAKTIERGEAVYFSRSRQCLWHKGDTSGHVQEVVSMLVDCDQDALVMKVRQKGPGCCHVGFRSCFYRRLPKLEDLEKAASGEPVGLEPEIEDKAYDPDKVYS